MFCTKSDETTNKYAPSVQVFVMIKKVSSWMSEKKVLTNKGATEPERLAKQIKYFIIQLC